MAFFHHKGWLYICWMRCWQHALFQGASPDPNGVLVCGCLYVEVDASYSGCPAGNCERPSAKEEIMALLNISSYPQVRVCSSVSDFCKGSDTKSSAIYQSKQWAITQFNGVSMIFWQLLNSVKHSSVTFEDLNCNKKNWISKRRVNVSIILEIHKIFPYRSSWNTISCVLARFLSFRAKQNNRQKVLP